MEHKGTQRIETERLVLRRFEPDDAEAMYKNWASDPEVTKFLTWPPHKSVDITRKLIDMWVSEYSQPDSYSWVIVLKEINEPIGSIAVVKLDEATSTAQIGYCLGREWWHRGIMTEALGAVIDFAFDEIGANRVEAVHDPNNPNSGKVMLKCGMKYEGTLRQASVNNQGIVDSAYYSILRSDRTPSA